MYWLTMCQTNGGASEVNNDSSETDNGASEANDEAVLSDNDASEIAMRLRQRCV